MTIVIKNTNSNSISVNQGAATQTGIVVKKQAAAATLESIPNVSAVGLDNGDTLVYNATTRKWEAKPISIEVGGAIDGGTY